MTQTKAGRDPEGAEKQIEAQAQPDAEMLETLREIAQMWGPAAPVAKAAIAQAEKGAPQAQPDAGLLEALKHEHQKRLDRSLLDEEGVLTEEDHEESRRIAQEFREGKRAEGCNACAAIAQHEKGAPA